MKALVSKHIVKIVFCAVTLFITCLGIVSALNLRNAAEESGKVQASLDVLLKIEDVSNSIQTIESSQRGYTITGDPRYLDSYFKKLTQLRKDTTSLTAIKLKNKQDLQQRTTLLKYIGQKVAFSKKVVEVRRLYGYDSANSQMQTRSGQVYMYSILLGIDNIKKKNKQLLRTSNIYRQKYAWQTTVALLILGVFILLAICYCYYIISTDEKSIYKRDIQLRYNASLIKNIIDPIITTNEHFHVTNWNVQATDLYGYREDEVIGKFIGDILKIEYINESLESVIQIFYEKQHWSGEVIHHHKDGTPIIVEVSSSAIRSAEGLLKGTVAVIRNITNRKKMEKELQKLTDNLQKEVTEKSKELTHIFDRVADAFIALDKNWNYTYVNKKAAEMHRMPADTLIGKNIWQTFPDTVDEPFYEDLHKAMATQQPQRAEVFFSKTGQWFEDLIYPSPDGVSVYYRDITERKTAQLNIQKMDEKLNYHISNTPMVVIELDANECVVQWSARAAEIFGYNASEAIGKTFVDLNLVLAEDLDAVKQSFANLRLEQKNEAISNRNVTRNGDIIYCEWYNSLLRNEQQEIIGIMCLGQDITLRKKAQQSLEISENKYRLLFANNPLPMWITERSTGNFLDVNAAAEQFFGYDRATFLQMHSSKLLAPASEAGNDENHHKNELSGIVPHITRAGAEVKMQLLYHEIDYDGKQAQLILATDETEKLAVAENLEKSHAELRDLATHLETVRETERTHMAREIHDELGQQLTGLKMEIAWLNKRISTEDEQIKNKLSDTLKLIDNTVVTVRRIATQLRPSILDDLGLISAMEWQSDEFEKKTEMHTEFSSNVAVLNLNPDIATNVFRIYQESLTNVVRHADASEVKVQLTAKDGLLHLTICDNGIGFDMTGIEDKKTLGLRGIQERVLLLKGSYKMNSAPLKGTQLSIVIPI